MDYKISFITNYSSFIVLNYDVHYSKCQKSHKVSCSLDEGFKYSLYFFYSYTYKADLEIFWGVVPMKDRDATENCSASKCNLSSLKLCCSVDFSCIFFFTFLCKLKYDNKYLVPCSLNIDTLLVLFYDPWKIARDSPPQNKNS